MGLATSVDERWELTRAVGVEAKCPVNKEAHVAVVEYDQKRDYEVEEEDTQLRRWGLDDIQSTVLQSTATIAYHYHGNLIVPIKRILKP